jgi:hypothetical protein
MIETINQNQATNIMNQKIDNRTSMNDIEPPPKCHERADRPVQASSLDGRDVPAITFAG